MNAAQSNKIWSEWERLYATAAPRFKRYGERDREAIAPDKVGEVALDALSKVAWNTSLAEALTPVLQATEIALRNYIDRAMRQRSKDVFKDEDAAAWLMRAELWLHPNDADLVIAVRQRLQNQVDAGERQNFCHDDVLASVSFVFWSNCVKNGQVWAALSNYQGGALVKNETPRTLHKVLDDIRNLRNRAYHLEPIFAQTDIWDVYEAARSRLSVMAKRMAVLTESIDRFPETWAEGRGWQSNRSRLYLHYGLDKLADPE